MTNLELLALAALSAASLVHTWLHDRLTKRVDELEDRRTRWTICTDLACHVAKPHEHRE